MSSFSKIIETLSSSRKLHSTPYFDFNYEGRPPSAQGGGPDRTETLRRYIKKLERESTSLTKEKDSLNEKALTSVLDDREGERLSEIFSHIEKNNVTKSRLEAQINQLGGNLAPLPIQKASVIEFQK